jgi:F-type H+-transporting ATPase subunit a
VLYLLGFKMTQDDLFISARPEPLFCLSGALVGGEECHGGLGVPFTNSILMTIIVDLLLVLAIIFGARNMKLIPTGFQNMVEVIIEVFYNFALGVDRKNIAKFFPLPATIFLFFLVGNFLPLIPTVGSVGWCRPVGEEHATALFSAPSASPGSLFAQEQPGEPVEPSIVRGLPGDCPKSQGNVLIPFLRAPAADLNITMAFSLVAVLMVEVYGFQALGIGYLGKFFNFREGILPAIVGIMELFSEFMRLIAFAFRIFGNIFGGEVVLVVMSFLFPFLLPLPFYGLEVFVAIIQAVIFAVLTLIFMSLAVQAHGHDAQGHPEPIEEADSMARALPH